MIKIRLKIKLKIKLHIKVQLKKQCFGKRWIADFISDIE